MFNTILTDITVGAYLVMNIGFIILFNKAMKKRDSMGGANS